MTRKNRNLKKLFNMRFRPLHTLNAWAYSYNLLIIFNERELDVRTGQPGAF